MGFGHASVASTLSGKQNDCKDSEFIFSLNQDRCIPILLFLLLLSNQHYSAKQVHEIYLSYIEVNNTLNNNTNRMNNK